MSSGYARESALVNEEADYYNRALDATLALTFVSFTLGLLALTKVVGLATGGAALTDLFVRLVLVGVGGVGTVGLFAHLNVVSIPSRRVRGVGVGLVVALVGLSAVTVAPGLDLETLLGLALLAEGGAVGAAGVASRLGAVDTEPSASAGLLAGLAFGAVGFVVGVALNGVALGGAVPVWATGLGAAFALAALTVLPREDLGSTLPVAVLVALLGVVVAAPVVGPGWEWQPADPMDGGLTGGVVVPLFVLLGSLLAGWGAAKARARYGARGRQYGSFQVIYLIAVLTVVAMISIVLFVAMRGLNYAFHGFRIGAPSALVLLSPLLILALGRARTPAGAPEWHSGVRQVGRVLPLAAVGAVAALLMSVVVSGEPFRREFTYTVLVNRQEETLETAFAITPEATVGTLVVLVPGLVIFGYFFRTYGSLSQVGRALRRQRAVQRGFGLATGTLLALAALFAVLGTTPFGLPLGGAVGPLAVSVAALAAAGLAVAAVGVFLRGDGGLPARAHDGAQVVKVGLFGGLGLLAGAVVLQPAAGALPAVGSTDLVPAVAAVAAVAALGVAALAAYARRSVTGDAERTLRRRVLAEEVRLGLAGAAGFVVLLALHVAVTGSAFRLGGLVVGVTGTLSWPMTMAPEIPLGAEPGGILPAVVGTVWLVVGAAAFAIPLGVGAAIFLTEYAERGRFTALVEIATNALWSTPSVVFGLFGAALLIPRIGGDESIMSAMLVLGFMLLPLVVITSREAIKAVPDEYRDASAALGVDRWETIRSVVLPAAVPGVITGVILGIGRIAGETAPLILVLGVGSASEPLDVLGSFQFMAEPPFVYNGALLEASRALPKQVWAVIAAGVSGSPAKGWGTALILLGVVLSFYLVGVLTRRYFRRKLDYE